VFFSAPSVGGAWIGSGHSIEGQAETAQQNKGHSRHDIDAAIKGLGFAKLGFGGCARRGLGGIPAVGAGVCGLAFQNQENKQNGKSDF
jgi:hypothetical protein